MRIQTSPGTYRELTAIQYARTIHPSLKREIAEHAKTRGYVLERREPFEARWWGAASFWLRR